MVTLEELVKAADEMRIDLQEWQRDLIMDRDTKKWVLNCGRKVGKTTAVEFRCAARLLNDAIPGIGLSGGICVLSKGMTQAKEILVGTKAVLACLGWDFTKERAKISEEKKIAFSSAHEVQMPNKNRMLVLPSGRNADNVRPYSFHELDYDEADFLPEDVYTSTAACLARFDGIEILESTPNTLANKHSHFAKAFFEKIPGYRILCIPTSMAPHISPSWLAEQRRVMSRAEFSREYECTFTSDIDGVFPPGLVKERTMEGLDWEVMEKASDAVFLGITFARFGDDESVVALNSFKDGVCHIRIKLIRGGTRIMAVEEELQAMVKENPKISKLVVDDRELGTGPTQGLTDIFSGSMIAAVTSHSVLKDTEGGRSRYLKEDLYVNLLKLMERGKVVLDADPRITNALIDTKYEYHKRSGMVRIWSDDPAAAEAIVRSVFPIWGQNTWYGDIRDAIRIIR